MMIIHWFGEQVQTIFGPGHRMIYALVLLVCLDYITGVCVAIQSHQLSSDIGAKGITRKVAIFIVIAFCHILDTYLIESGSALEPVSLAFYLSNEAISIFENIARLGVPLPDKLKQLLNVLKKHTDEE